MEQTALVRETYVFYVTSNSKFFFENKILGNREKSLFAIIFAQHFRESYEIAFQHE